MKWSSALYIEVCELAIFSYFFFFLYIIFEKLLLWLLEAFERFPSDFILILGTISLECAVWKASADGEGLNGGELSSRDALSSYAQFLELSFLTLLTLTIGLSFTIKLFTFVAFINDCS